MLWSCCCHTGRGLSPLSSLLFQSILKNSCPYPSRWFTLDFRFVAVMNVYCISKFQPRSSSEDLKILGVLLTCLFKCFHIVIMILHRPYLDRTASYTTWTAKEAELSGPVGHSDIVMNKKRTSCTTVGHCQILMLSDTGYLLSEYRLWWCQYENLWLI